MILSEILISEKKFYIITDSNTKINIYLNQKQIYKFNYSINEKVKNFINFISNKIPYDSTLIHDGFEIDINEFENEDLKNILDNNNNIYFISSKQIENIRKEEERKENILIQSKEKIIINYGKNSIIEKLDVSMNLKELRKLLLKKNIINFHFILKYNDEETILNKNNENDINIEDIFPKNEDTKIIFLKVEEKNKFDDSENNNNLLFINFFNKNNNKLLEKELNTNLNLSEIRNNIQNKIKKDFLFLKNNQKDEIEKNNEFNYKLKEIKNSNNNVYINLIDVLKQIKIKINEKEAFAIKTKINISLKELKNHFEKIPNDAKFLIDNYCVSDELTTKVNDILEDNEIINLKIDENENPEIENLKSEVENTQIKYKIYLNGKFLKFLKQFKKAN